MTLEDLKGMDKVVITPAEAAQVLNCDPHWIRLTARERPEALGFPAICLGSRVKIPRLPFIQFLEGGAA